MAYSVSSLIRQIRSGDQKAMDAAATILCKRRVKKAVRPLVSITYHNNAMVRGIAAICLGVIGDRRGLKALERLKFLDEDKNVRRAAFIAIKHFGKSTYDVLKNELRSYEQFPIEEAFPSKPSPAEDRKRPSMFSRIPFLGRFPVFTREKQIAIIAVVLGSILGVFVLMSPKGKRIDFKDEANTNVIESKTIGDKLIARRKAVADFRSKNLDPKSPDSKSPKTMAITTYGEELNELTDRIYETPQLSKGGKNTVLASWRKMNYSATRQDRIDSLLYNISVNEQLIFPNIPAMHLEYNIKEGSVAFEAMEQLDPEVEVVVIVEKVTVK